MSCSIWKYHLWFRVVLTHCAQCIRSSVWLGFDNWKLGHGGPPRHRVVFIKDFYGQLCQNHLRGSLKCHFPSSIPDHQTSLGLVYFYLASLMIQMHTKVWDANWFFCQGTNSTTTFLQHHPSHTHISFYFTEWLFLQDRTSVGSMRSQRLKTLQSSQSLSL